MQAIRQNVEIQPIEQENAGSYDKTGDEIDARANERTTTTSTSELHEVVLHEFKIVA